MKLVQMNTWALVASQTIWIFFSKTAVIPSCSLYKREHRSDKLHLQVLRPTSGHHMLTLLSRYPRETRRNHSLSEVPRLRRGQTWTSRILQLVESTRPQRSFHNGRYSRERIFTSKTCKRKCKWTGWRQRIGRLQPRCIISKISSPRKTSYSRTCTRWPSLRVFRLAVGTETVKRACLQRPTQFRVTRTIRLCSSQSAATNVLSGSRRSR